MVEEAAAAVIRDVRKVDQEAVLICVLLTRCRLGGPKREVVMVVVVEVVEVVR